MVEAITGETYKSKAIFATTNINVASLKDIPPYKDKEYITLKSNISGKYMAILDIKPMPMLRL